jgi:hypothetical protein
MVSSSWFRNFIYHGFFHTAVLRANDNSSVPFLHQGLVAQSISGSLGPFHGLFEEYMPHAIMVHH